MMKRRAVIASLALGPLWVARAARPQPARKVYRIGMLGVGSTTAEMVAPSPTLQPSTRCCADCASSATCTASIS